MCPPHNNYDGFVGICGPPNGPSPGPSLNYIDIDLMQDPIED